MEWVSGHFWPTRSELCAAGYFLWFAATWQQRIVYLVGRKWRTRAAQASRLLRVKHFAPWKLGPTTQWFGLVLRFNWTIDRDTAIGRISWRRLNAEWNVWKRQHKHLVANGKKWRRILWIFLGPMKQVIDYTYLVQSGWLDYCSLNLCNTRLGPSETVCVCVAVCSRHGRSKTFFGGCTHTHAMCDDVDSEYVVCGIICLWLCRPSRLLTQAIETADFDWPLPYGRLLLGLCLLLPKIEKIHSSATLMQIALWRSGRVQSGTLGLCRWMNGNRRNSWCWWKSAVCFIVWLDD